MHLALSKYDPFFTLHLQLPFVALCTLNYVFGCNVDHPLIKINFH